QALPVLDVAPDALLGGLVEPLDAVALDVGLTREAELLLDLDLDRQAVGVPAAARADDVLAAHAPVADHDILRGARLDLLDPGAPGGGRRPLEEDEGARPIAALERLLDDAVLLPPALDRALELRKRASGVDLPKCHDPLLYATKNPVPPGTRLRLAPRYHPA